MNKKLNKFTNPEGSPENKCPVSGLTVVSLPEFTNVYIKGDYYTTLKKIGDSIVYMESKGSLKNYDLDKYNALIEAFCASTGVKKPYTQIRSHEHITGRLPFNTMKRQISYFYQNQDTISGIILLKWPSWVKPFINQALRLYKPSFSVLSADNYSDAITATQQLLAKNKQNTSGISAGVTNKHLLFKDILFKPEWKYENSEGGFKCSIGVIPELLLYISLHGKLSSSDDLINAAILLEKVIEENALRGIPYILTELTELEAVMSKRLRQQYAKEVKRVITATDNQNAKRIIINPGRFNKIALNLFAPFLKAQFIFVDSVEEAVKIINEHTECLEINDSEDGFYITAADLEELSNAFGELQWGDTENTTEVKVSSGNPLAYLTESLELIKSDLNELRENEKRLSDERLQESEALLALKQFNEDIVQNINEGIVISDNLGLIVFANQALQSIIGYKADELIGTHWKTIVRPADYRIVDEANGRRNEGITDRYELMLKHKNGLTIPVQISGSPYYDSKSGEMVGTLAVLTDITDRKKAEEALSYRLAFEKLVSGISAQFVNLPPEELDRGINEVLKSIGLYFKADRSYIYEFIKDNTIYTNTHIWCAPGIDAYYEKDQNEPVIPESCWEGELLRGNIVNINDVDAMPPELEIDKRDFQLEEIQSLLTIPLVWDGKVFGCFGLDHVIKKQVWSKEQVSLLQVVADLVAGAIIRHKSEQRIRRLSFYDQLTDLFNRRYFENELTRLDNSREHPIAVISSDLDGLKLVNDTLGHAEGDRYLQVGAELLRANLRSSDTLARVGGDEFALLLPRTGKTEAGMLMNRIRRQVEGYNLAQKGLPLSISLGLAISEGPDYPLEETFRAADDNMYNDKLKQGKKARAEIVSSLLSSLFERGNLAEGERDQVQELSIRMGLVLKLEENRMVDLEMLTQVYDLGKVGLPDGLLHSDMLTNKDELTEAEREAIYRHPETGYRIASASPELANIAEMVLKHHENYDGSGYPLGLKGEMIPLENRILSIAIAYSAMTNPRPYAKTLTHEEALDELKRCAGSQFDPQLVEIFLGM